MLNNEQATNNAAIVPSFNDFAEGRTSFGGPLIDWKDGRIAREAAVGEIARRNREWVSLFRGGRRREPGDSRPRR